MANLSPVRRYDLSNNPSNEQMSGNRKAVQQSVRVKLHGGALESSNVNVVEAMVSMISISRQFDMQMKILQNADGNDRQAAQLLSMR